jgi:electron transfer flavoprotein alpha subunit
MTTILVWVEEHHGNVKRASLEALGAARAAGETVVAVLCGRGAASAAPNAAGASKAVLVTGAETYSPDALAATLAGLVREHGAAAFLASATSTGRDLAPRVAAHLDATLFSDCTALSREGDSFRVTRPWLAGKVIARQACKAPVLCATLRRNLFEPATAEGTVEVTETQVAGGGLAQLVEVAEKAEGNLDVAEAPIVVSGGRGLKGPEHFNLVEDLAAAFGNAAVGASRAVVDAGWRPHSEQVGQTGKTVSPQIYVAVGISGAIQHLAGMRTSKVIVAINKDADAPIFKLADYGIVGDAFEVLPALTEQIKKIRAEG